MVFWVFVKFIHTLKYTRVKVVGDVSLLSPSLSPTSFPYNQALTTLRLSLYSNLTNISGEISSVESVKAVGDVGSPIGGTVIAVNEELESTPGLINSSPEDGGLSHCLGNFIVHYLIILLIR